MEDTKIIQSAGVARQLLKAGCTIIDIKPSKFHKNATVFVFKKDEKFIVEFAKIQKEATE